MYLLLIVIIIIIIINIDLYWTGDKYSFKLQNLLPYKFFKKVVINIPYAYKLLDELHTIFSKHKIPFYLSEGTALGFFRNNDFIPHDDDIDIGIINKPKNLYILIDDLLNNYGFTLNSINVYGYPYIQIRKYNINIDIEVVRTNQKCISKMESCNKLLPYLKKFKIIFINNKKFHIPTRKYYEYIYGKNWYKPKYYKPVIFPLNIIYKIINTYV